MLVVGDFGLDTYTLGVAERISPEAPVAVVRIKEEKSLPGMAGNVALNLVSLGANVSVLGRLGQDDAGKMIEETLQDEGVNCHFFTQENFSTSVKNRIIADHQQIVRVDREEVCPLSEKLEKKIEEDIERLLLNHDVVALSDYGKGFCSRKLLFSLIQRANAMNIPVVVDPKGVDFTKYEGCTVIKPNLKEAYAASGLEKDVPFEEHAKRLLEKTQADYLIVTMSDKGMALYSKDGHHAHFPVTKRQILDVTGAGDTTLATFVFCLANGLGIEKAVELSNVAAGVAIEQFGCARVTLSDIAERLLKERVGNKVYDSHTHDALRESLKENPFTLFEIAPGEKLSASLWRSICECKAEGRPLVVLLHAYEGVEELLPLLASLQQVDAILTDFSPTQSFVPHDYYQFSKGQLTSSLLNI